MRHRLAALTLTLPLAAGLAGCGKDEGTWAAGTAPVSAAPTVTAAPRPGAVASASAMPVGQTVAGKLSATGYGPYAIGTPQGALNDAGLVGKISTDRNGCGTANGAAKWKSPGLVFTAGRLDHIKITKTGVATTKGVKVGATLAKIMERYPDGKALADWNGAPGWFAASGDFALLFRLKNNKVTAIEAGTATTLQFTFTDNQGC